jgi:hypothetical protein
MGVKRKKPSIAGRLRGVEFVALRFADAKANPVIEHVTLK